MSNPYRFEPSVEVVYADIAEPDELQSYRRSNPIPGLYAGEMPNIEIILKRPTFSFPEDCHGRFDFVFSSNVLEHHPNPAFFLLDQLNVLKIGGVLYCKIPNKHFMYDRPRAITSLETFKRKFEESNFTISPEEAREIVTQTDSHPNYDLLKIDVDANARRMVEAGDGTHHLSVFEDSNTFDLINFVQLKRRDVYISHFSAQCKENIEFALKVIPRI